MKLLWGNYTKGNFSELKNQTISELPEEQQLKLWKSLYKNYTSQQLPNPQVNGSDPRTKLLEFMNVKRIETNLSDTCVPCEVENCLWCTNRTLGLCGLCIETFRVTSDMKSCYCPQYQGVNASGYCDGCTTQHCGNCAANSSVCNEC